MSNIEKSTITIDVYLDRDKIPERISWNATQSSVEEPQDAKAMMVSFWDGKEKSALRIDLWNKEMMMDEMADFVYQNLMSIAENFERATRQKELAGEMKTFAKGFIKKFQDIQEKSSQQPK